MHLDPQRFTAGETQTWTVSLADYLPGDGWTLALNAGSSSGAFTTDGVTSGTSHLLTLTAVVSAEFTAGDYRYQLTVTKGTGDDLERHIVETGYLTVEALLDGSTSAESRSTWRQIHADLKTAYKDYVSTGALRTFYSIGDKSTSFQNHEQMLTAIHNARAEVVREDRLERQRNGLPLGSRILTRF